MHECRVEGTEECDNIPGHSTLYGADSDCWVLNRMVMGWPTESESVIDEPCEQLHEVSEVVICQMDGRPVAR